MLPLPLHITTDQRNPTQIILPHTLIIRTTHVARIAISASLNIILIQRCRQIPQLSPTLVQTCRCNRRFHFFSSHPGSPLNIATHQPIPPTVHRIVNLYRHQTGRTSHRLISCSHAPIIGQITRRHRQRLRRQLFTLR